MADFIEFPDCIDGLELVSIPPQPPTILDSLGRIRLFGLEVATPIPRLPLNLTTFELVMTSTLATKLMGQLPRPRVVIRVSCFEYVPGPPRPV